MCRFNLHLICRYKTWADFAFGNLGLQLLAREDEALLIRGDTFLVLNLCLHVVNRVTGLECCQSATGPSSNGPHLEFVTGQHQLTRLTLTIS